MPPARKFAILTCMDARLDPAKYAGLAEDYFLMDVASILRSFSLLAAS
jgi:carbonic anhydrase